MDRAELEQSESMAVAAWDGSGYPDGLGGAEIPLHARVLTVADVYDALTSPRCYRPALTVREALATMEREVGCVLDPELFECLAGLVTRSPLAVLEGVAPRRLEADPQPGASQA